MNAHSQRIVDDIERAVRRQYPNRDDVSMASIAACDDEVIRAYGTEIRVRVQNIRYPDDVRTGTVSRTTGWHPALLLIHRSNASGSSDILGPDDRIVGVQRGKKYVSTGSVFA